MQIYSKLSLTQLSNGKANLELSRIFMGGQLLWDSSFDITPVFDNLFNLTQKPYSQIILTYIDKGLEPAISPSQLAIIVWFIH